MFGFYSFVFSVCGGLIANAITIYWQSEGRMGIGLLVTLGYFIIMVFIGYFVYKHYSNETAQTKKFENENQYRRVIKDIADNKKDKESALMNYGAEGGFSVVPTTDTWQLWIKGLVKTTNRADLDYYNFGKEYYFFDFSSCKKVKIPTGNDARRIKIEDSVRPGMVLRLMACG